MSADDLLRLSVRLPPAFHAEAEAYAASLGVSFNALVAFALRQYLDRAKAAPVETAPAPAVVAGPLHAGGAGGSGRPTDAGRAPARPAVPKVAKGQPCPCGSRKPYGKCHGRTP